MRTETLHPPYSTEGGFATLGPEPTELVRLLDETFREWALRDGARPMTAPALLPVAGLAKLDFYQNFPQLALVASRFDLADGRPAPTGAAAAGAVPGADLDPAALALPSTVCYGVYLGHTGAVLAENTAVTLVGQCFRNEEHYDGLRRLMSFRMREVVALGSAEFAQRHVDHYADLTERFTRAIGLPVVKEAATDPFFDREGPRALMQRLIPVKYEFLYGGTAIASVNTHRNFFGERCGISLDGQEGPAFTSCVGFGFERWVHALADHFAGDWDAALTAVVRARADVG
ncbi:hypothetical protein [Kitasatospora purpeofusca]|uniref:hypothetical protein n=1 Tax=Kitasatospora purpeofusca TaxID=67352 RepID=UPI002A5A205C|nr:hypothetical protein [Kitasatospora purpeofusca]MDY0812151.1 hypothetical protein [Kitasatospora purpeofusca]